MSKNLVDRKRVIQRDISLRKPKNKVRFNSAKTKMSHQIMPVFPFPPNCHNTLKKTASTSLLISRQDKYETSRKLTKAHNLRLDTQHVQTKSLRPMTEQQLMPMATHQMTIARHMRVE